LSLASCSNTLDVEAASRVNAWCAVLEAPAVAENETLLTMAIIAALATRGDFLPMTFILGFLSFSLNC
jgi:hypothetical protein